MISILLPTRKRPERLMRTLRSIRETAVGDVEVLCYITHDDDSYDIPALEAPPWNVKVVRGERMFLSDLWNALIPHAYGDIFMQCADDVLMRTPAWDRYVEVAFAAVPDRILLVYGNDCHWNAERFATLPFVHRRWYEILGHFTGVGYSVDYSDTHSNDISDMIFRKKYLPVIFEHNHVIWGKSEMDDTYKEVQEIRIQDNCSSLYASRLPERVACAEKLQKAFGTPWGR